MENSPAPRSLSELLLDLKTSMPGDETSVAALLEAFHERGFGFFLFLLGLVSAVPIPGFGLRTALAVPMMLFTLQQMLGFHTIWLPASIKQRSLKTAALTGMIDHLLPWTARLEKITRPRLGFMTRGLASKLIGLCGFIMAACIFMPLILTNMVPAIGIILMSVGVLMRDGLAVIAGMIIGTVWSIGWFFVFFYYGSKGLNIAVDTVTSYFH